MIQIRKRYKGLKWNTIYYAAHRVKQIEKNSDVIEYNYLISDKSQIKTLFPKSCKNREFVTLVTNLNQSEETLYNKIEKNGRYEIRRAEREEVMFYPYDSSIRRDILEEIIDFYNSFVDTKKELSFKLSYEWIKPFLEQKAFWCTVAAKDGDVLAVHLYYGDNSRIRLWYSASLFRNEDDGQKKNAIGRANRFLHWKDICFFKQVGFRTYDWGGYSAEGDTAGNGKFKKSFGGDMEIGLCILTYGSLLGWVGLKISQIKNKMAKIYQGYCRKN